MASTGNNSFASNVRKVHIHVEKLLGAAAKLPAQHRAEAALQAHVLAAKAMELSRKLRSEEILGGHYRHESTPVKKSIHRRAHSAKKARRR